MPKIETAGDLQDFIKDLRGVIDQYTHHRLLGQKTPKFLFLSMPFIEPNHKMDADALLTWVEESAFQDKSVADRVGEIEKHFRQTLAGLKESSPPLKKALEELYKKYQLGESKNLKNRGPDDEQGEEMSDVVTVEDEHGHKLPKALGPKK